DVERARPRALVRWCEQGKNAEQVKNARSTATVPLPAWRAIHMSRVATKHTRVAVAMSIPADTHDSQVLSFRQWCALNNISARTGWRIIKQPGGPTITRLSPRRMGITVANNRQWQQSRERA